MDIGRRRDGTRCLSGPQRNRRRILGPELDHGLLVSRPTGRGRPPGPQNHSRQELGTPRTNPSSSSNSSSSNGIRCHLLRQGRGRRTRGPFSLSGPLEIRCCPPRRGHAGLCGLDRGGPPTRSRRRGDDGALPQHRRRHRNGRLRRQVGIRSAQVGLQLVPSNRYYHPPRHERTRGPWDDQEQARICHGSRQGEGRWIDWRCRCRGVSV
mmetsp:Transcript_4803/g.10596  ORF Transcript_4803/g.10596 Transcript_4803/m.10596 type:complete len:209 (-) Transcript_4803:387-1013(-)